MRDRINGTPLTSVGARIHTVADAALDDLWLALDAECECPTDIADAIWRAARAAARHIIARECADAELMVLGGEH